MSADVDEKQKCTDLLTKYDYTKKEWQLGKTKVGPLDSLILCEDTNACTYIACPLAYRCS